MVSSLCSVSATLPFIVLPGNSNPCCITELKCALHQIYYEDQTGRSELLHSHNTKVIGILLISSSFLGTIQYVGFNL